MKAFLIIILFSTNLNYSFNNKTNLFSCKDIHKPPTLEPIQLVYCDSNYDGLVSINIKEIKNNVLVQNINNFGYEEGIYISTAFNRIHKVTNLNSIPSINLECQMSNSISFGYGMLDIAIDQNDNCFICSDNAIYNFNKNNCTYSNYYVFNDYGNNISINSMSFDYNNDLYFGGFDSKVYKISNNDFDNEYVWHDFNQGKAAGDFVMFDDKMYIAWRLDNQYYLYEVTVNEEYEYISHANLGLLPNQTFGLASELGSLYGITPFSLYKIELDNGLNFQNILENETQDKWYGASGQNEAVKLQVNAYLSENDALNQLNPLPNTLQNTIAGGQIIYVSIINVINGNQIIVPVEIIINTPPVYNDIAEVHNCSNNPNPNHFDLDILKNDINGDPNVDISFYLNSEHANNQTNELNSYLVTNYNIQSITVRVENITTSCSINFPLKLIVNDPPICNDITDTKICVDDLNDYYQNINLSNYNNLLLENQTDKNISISYYLSMSDAVTENNEINSLLIDLNTTFTTIFSRLEDQKTNCFNICNFNIYFEEFVPTSNFLTNIEVEEWTANQNTIIVDIQNIDDYIFSLDGYVFQSNPIFENLEAGNYNLTIKNIKTCEYSIENLLLLSYPNFFTPNQDGFNDTWSINFSNFEASMKVMIFDRYGKLIASLIDGITWDGKYNGSELPSSDYWFIVKRENGRNFKGHFSLIR